MVLTNTIHIEPIFKDHQVKVTKSENAKNYSFAKPGEENTKIFVCSNKNTLFYSGGFGTFVFRLGGSGVNLIEHFKTDKLRLDYWADKIICSDTKPYAEAINSSLAKLQNIMSLEFDEDEIKIRKEQLEYAIEQAGLNSWGKAELIKGTLYELSHYTGWLGVLEEFEIVYKDSTNYLICIYVLNKLAKMEE